MSNGMSARAQGVRVGDKSIQDWFYQSQSGNTNILRMLRRWYLSPFALLAFSAVVTPSYAAIAPITVQFQGHTGSTINGTFGYGQFTTAAAACISSAKATDSWYGYPMACTITSITESLAACRT